MWHRSRRQRGVRKAPTIRRESSCPSLSSCIALVSYRVRAFNTATASANKIHDDDVARALGFRGGLVPGVDVYAYLCHEPAARWGRSWLERGTIEARFLSPVYDGDEVE